MNNHMKCPMTDADWNHYAAVMQSIRVTPAEFSAMMRLKEFVAGLPTLAQLIVAERQQAVADAEVHTPAPVKVAAHSCDASCFPDTWHQLKDTPWVWVDPNSKVHACPKHVMENAVPAAPASEAEKCFENCSDYSCVRMGYCTGSASRSPAPVPVSAAEREDEPTLSMSMFASKADYDAAVAARALRGTVDEGACDISEVHGDVCWTHGCIALICKERHAAALENPK